MTERQGNSFFLLILLENTIRMSADFLIVFSISQGENKICSIENKISQGEILNRPILMMPQNCVIFVLRALRSISSDSRGRKIRKILTSTKPLRHRLRRNTSEDNKRVLEHPPTRILLCALPPPEHSLQPSETTKVRKEGVPCLRSSGKLPSNPSSD